MDLETHPKNVGDSDLSSGDDVEENGAKLVSFVLGLEGIKGLSDGEVLSD